jgi:hypothetical protein
MLNVMASTAKSKNPGLVSSTRNDDEDNVDWLERQLRVTEMRREVSAKSAPSDANRAIDRKPTYIILFGGCDRAAFRLRLAQAHLRDDLWPSHWSHAALLGSPQEEFSKQSSLKYRCSRAWVSNQPLSPIMDCRLAPYPATAEPRFTRTSASSSLKFRWWHGCSSAMSRLHLFLKCSPGSERCWTRRSLSLCG